MNYNLSEVFYDLSIHCASRLVCVTTTAALRSSIERVLKNLSPQLDAWRFLLALLCSVVCKGSDWIWHLLQRETRENWLLLTFISSTFESYLVRAQTFHLVWVWRIIVSLLGEECCKFLWRLWRAVRLVIATYNLSRYIAHFPPIFAFIYWRLDSHIKTMFVGKYDVS